MKLTGLVGYILPEGGQRMDSSRDLSDFIPRSVSDSHPLTAFVDHLQ